MASRGRPGMCLPDCPGCVFASLDQADQRQSCQIWRRKRRRGSASRETSFSFGPNSFERVGPMSWSRPSWSLVSPVVCLCHDPRAWLARACAKREGSAGPSDANFHVQGPITSPAAQRSSKVPRRRPFKAMLIKCRTAALTSAATHLMSPRMMYFWDLRGNHKQLILLAGNASTTSNLFGGMLSQCRQARPPE